MHSTPDMATTQILLWMLLCTTSLQDTGFFPTTTDSSTTDTTSYQCGGYFYDYQGTISSPNSPDLYPNNVNCVWELGNFAVTYIIDLQYLDIEESINCTSDSLKIYNNDGLVANLCNNYISVWSWTIEYASSLRIQFSTDASIQNTGFSLIYRIDWRTTTPNYPEWGPRFPNYQACGEYLTADEGYFGTPYWDVYPNYAYCVWEIQVPYGRYIRLTFTYMDLEYKPECTSDSVQIYDSYYTLLGKICTIEPNTMFWTQSSRMRVVLTTDSAVQKRGFQATYETYTRTTAAYTVPNYPNYQCGGSLIGDSGSFSTPFYPEQYPNNAICIWDIQVPAFHFIELTFQSIELEVVLGCIFDYVQIYDGPTALRKICTNDTTAIQTTSNSMKVIFKSDVSVTLRGFSAFFNSYEIPSSAIPYPCGGTLTDQSGEFSSPNYPDLYPNNANCNWDIQVQPGYYITVTFTQFELEYVQSCSYDLVQLYDGFNPFSPICSNNGNTFSSTSNSMRVVFTSDGMVQKTGFFAVYNSYPNANQWMSTTPISSTDMG